MTYKEFKESEACKLMVNGFSLIDYYTDIDYSSDDHDFKYDNWIIRFTGVNCDEYVPAIYISKED